jgi:DNA-binding MarR family transcriptional regulator
LAAVGLTTTQFSILRAIERHRGPVALSELADEQVFERTSLYRALEPLERDGLVTIGAGKGRAKSVALTPKGGKQIARALPHWNAAQEAFVARFGRAAWLAMSAHLVDIADIARAMPDAER